MCLAAEEVHLELRETLLVAKLELRVLIDDADGLVALCLVIVVILLSFPVAPVARSVKFDSNKILVTTYDYYL